ncbi:T9SS type A sorting domain-containing protein, partial [Larkinella insperata]
SVLGLEMRGNTLRAGQPNMGADIHGDPYPEGYLNTLEFHSAGRDYVDEDIAAVLGTILENNTAINSEHAIHFNSGSYNTYVCNTRMTNVKNLVNDVFFNRVTHGAVRTGSCTPIPAQLTADAGPDRRLVLPTNSIVLPGKATSSPVGNIASTAWVKVSGPNPAMSSMNTLTPLVSRMPTGTYVFRLTVKDKDNRQVTDDVTIVVASSGTPSEVPDPTVPSEPSNPTSPSPSQQAVVSFSLMNANTDKEIKVLSNGEELNLAKLPTRNLNIRVNTSPTVVGSVVMELSGRQSRNQTETAAPYALFGDTNGDYKSWTPSTGSYTLKVTPYTEAGGKGTAGKALTINFTVVNQSSARMSAEDDPEIAGLTVKTYPNPFVDSFTLEVKGREEGKLPVVVYDSYGRAVLQLADVQPDQLIQFGNEHAPGMYILQVGEGDMTKRHKLMKN